MAISPNFFHLKFSKSKVSWTVKLYPFRSITAEGGEQRDGGKMGLGGWVWGE